ncbi:pre-mRNA-splicing factor CWC25 homolog [Catharus ustulatus]|uniref:CWC25 spliceosome associated protein homolog n=1 Tax=Catharus ustulatus TaxID=91951 RepID=A0A8C3USK5_CATUS|nr:pre-mRNA-splicing factor CWC25 homolog [Catharus ustulatus]
MGGGDLNLKKSWHPQTLRNVEKVWKAEQKHEAERRKIEELQRELQEERAREEMQRYAEDMGTVRKREEKLEWMYQGPGGMVNRDEYLLGRPVDKFILDKVGDKDSAASEDTGLLPGSIFARAGASSVLDMATKIREDPLFMIRKREEEKKREVLNNPVKMKKIKALLQSSLEKKERKRKKEKKRKHKKHRRRSSSSSSSSSSEEDRAPKKSQKKVESSSCKAAPSKIPGYGLQLRDPEQSQPQQGHQGHQGHSSRSHSRQHSREEKSRARSPSPKKSFRRQQPSGYTRKISPEELERKRQEMMENAKWREEERANNLRKHRREEELERELQKLDSRDGKFFHRLKLESASTSSLEDRVKRNIHSLQRTPAALEKNFMQR